VVAIVEEPLAADLAAWEASTSVHTWRNPTAWDARIMTALASGGYQPSDVERLLIGTDADSAA
jgi:ParB family chromosome partitioning protein